LKLKLYAIVDEALRRAKGHEIDRDFVLESLVLHLPQENYERVFRTFIGWGRYADLFVYDENSETIKLPAAG